MCKATGNREHDKDWSYKKIGFYILVIGIIIIGALLYFCSVGIKQVVPKNHPNNIPGDTVTWSK